MVRQFRGERSGGLRTFAQALGRTPHTDRAVAPRQDGPKSTPSSFTVWPWPHDKTVKLDGVDFGPDSDVPLRGIQMQWFDQFLKGKDTPLLSQAPVRVFVMGVNRWREEREWPPRAHRERFYLESRGHANTLAGDGRLRLHAPADEAAPA